MEIKTNNVPRDVIEDSDTDEAHFVYKGEKYYLSDFMRSTDPRYAEWDGIQADTYFSATLVKFVDNYERVIVGRTYA